MRRGRDPSLAATRPEESRLEVGAWLTYWELERGLERLAETSSHGIEPVFLFSAALSPEGDVLLVEDATRARAAAKSPRALLGRFS